MGDFIDPRTAIDIDRRIRSLLKEAHIIEPPLHLQEIAEHLEIDHSYYDLNDPGLLREFWHKLKIGSARATAILEKVSLKGLWLPDSQQIIVDSAVPDPKKKWVSAHEIAHKLIPTHNELFLGDTAETLDPEYHEMLEAEANYAASSLIFLEGKFTLEALDCEPKIKNVQLLSSRYRNSLASTLRRYVLFSHDIPIMGVISSPRWMKSKGERCRYFIRSRKFVKQFSTITANDVVSIIDAYTVKTRGGPCGKGRFPLRNDNGDENWFTWESFFNKYDLLTLASLTPLERDL